MVSRKSKRPANDSLARRGRAILPPFAGWLTLAPNSNLTASPRPSTIRCDVLLLILTVYRSADRRDFDSRPDRYGNELLGADRDCDRDRRCRHRACATR